MFGSEEQTILQSVALQLMDGDEVAVGVERHKVKRTGGGLRIVQVQINGRAIDAIEQNRNKPSKWGKLARERHNVVQFRDAATHKYVAVSVDGQVTEYNR